MMRRILSWMFALLLLTMTSAWAQDDGATPREGLMSMNAQIRMIHDWSSEKTYWNVYLQNGEDYESNVYILLTPEGELHSAEHGNG